ncbi:hypothetical protein BCF33_2215 [Hasllibacter halocynthiae]|uniref:Peptidase inhibitor I78 family protein n=1 Tax=Hasllibacter halocynthiae TaxID=595589 RepID=A0A2T0X360_9RHOB|nr:hypothetical protein [Hasllibacter halocynthiae]PRY93347.1 hypothetical protein BCF33_2215 [Hasllibacter halocynthiae]
MRWMIPALLLLTACAAPQPEADGPIPSCDLPSYGDLIGQVATRALLDRDPRLFVLRAGVDAARSFRSGRVGLRTTESGLIIGITCGRRT